MIQVDTFFASNLPAGRALPEGPSPCARGPVDGRANGSPPGDGEEGSFRSTLERLGRPRENGSTPAAGMAQSGTRRPVPREDASAEAPVEAENEGDPTAKVGANKATGADPGAEATAAAGDGQSSEGDADNALDVPAAAVAVDIPGTDLPVAPTTDAMPAAPLQAKAGDQTVWAPVEGVSAGDVPEPPPTDRPQPAAAAGEQASMRTAVEPAVSEQTAAVEVNLHRPAAKKTGSEAPSLEEKTVTLEKRPLEQAGALAGPGSDAASLHAALRAAGRGASKNGAPASHAAAENRTSQPPATPEGDRHRPVEAADVQTAGRSRTQTEGVLPLSGNGTETEQRSGDMPPTLPRPFFGVQGASSAAPEPVETHLRDAHFDALNQIVEKAVYRLKKGHSEVRIDLKPDFLGHVRMQIVTTNHQVTLRIVAETVGVKDLIDSGLPQLRNDLQANGLQVDDIDVSVANGFSHFNQHSAFEAGKRPGKRIAAVDASPAPDQAATGGRPMPSLAGRVGGIDYFA